MKSLWSLTSEFDSFKSLDCDKETDVLIIGGGLAGVLCAYMLHQAGVDYILTEAKTLGGGVTENTTAKITSQHSLIYTKLINEFGVKKANLYLQANERALERYFQLCHGIDCDFEKKTSFVYSLSDRSKIEKEAIALKKLGYFAELHNNIPMPFETEGALSFKNQAQFNPIKFLSSISKGLNIYENTEIKELIGTTAVTKKCRIKAKKIIVATHFPFLNKHGFYYAKLYQHRSYAIALENAPDIKGMYIDENELGLSFRNYKNLLIVGGGSHRTGKFGGNWKELRIFAEKYFPKAKEKYHWATQDCMSLDAMPYIGRYSSKTPDLFVATGFNKWGMTSSMVAGMLLCDLVQEKENKYEQLFSPSRSIFRPQLAVNLFESAVNLISLSPKRCPHLGCALKWNKCERTWDCPCHGSRFDEHGKLIDNPATGDLK